MEWEHITHMCGHQGLPRSLFLTCDVLIWQLYALRKLAIYLTWRICMKYVEKSTQDTQEMCFLVSILWTVLNQVLWTYLTETSYVTTISLAPFLPTKATNMFYTFKELSHLGMVTYTCNLSTKEGSLGDKGQHRSGSDTPLPLKNKAK